MIGHHPMPSLTQPETYRWSGGEFALFNLRLRVDELAERLGFSIDSWEEEGLGPARGAVLRLSTGKLILLQEQEYLIESGTTEGPCVWVDAADLAALGVTLLLHEVLGELGLDLEAVGWRQEPEAQAEAENQTRYAVTNERHGDSRREFRLALLEVSRLPLASLERCRFPPHAFQKGASCCCITSAPATGGSTVPRRRSPASRSK
jgi:hypothetical protein